jgi:tyrosinase
LPRSVTIGPIAAVSLASEFSRADIEFHGLDHAGASYEGRVFVNMPDADAQTARDVPQFAGCFHIFGHGGCLGDPGHCDVHPRRPFDPRPEHQLTPASKTVIATEALRGAIAAGEEISVTVVPVIMSTTPHIGRPEDVVDLDHVRIVTYA